MKSQTLIVLMGGEVMGSVTQQDNKLEFSYEDDYRFATEATPLSLSMPLAMKQHPDEIVRPFLWGLLPDSEAVLERWGRDYGVSPRNPFALLAHVGEECAGAAQFVRPERMPEISTEGSVEEIDESGVAGMLRGLGTDPTAWHGPAATGQFSLAGAQPKFALHWTGDGWGQPRGATPTTHIFKPAGNTYRELELNEHLCLSLARRLGLPAARSRVAVFEDQRAIVIERYDRQKADQGWIRIHQEDLCQASGLHPAIKYQWDGGPSPVSIVSLFRSAQPAEEAERSVKRFADALVLNWIICGTDAHAKNYSLLLSGAEVRVAPLYDVASVLPYGLDPHDVKFAMKIGHSYKLLDISLRDWKRTEAAMGLDEGSLVRRIERLCASAPSAMEAVCADPDVVALESDMPKTLLDAVCDRVVACSKLISAR
jgi:serine/threonine-protein kinase HipA